MVSSKNFVEKLFELRITKQKRKRKAIKLFLKDDRINTVDGILEFCDKFSNLLPKYTFSFSVSKDLISHNLDGVMIYCW